MTPTFTVIVPTNGRATLSRTLNSIAPQLEDGDELIVARRDNAPWGHATRNECIERANGTHLWFMDDDDIATDDALTSIRSAVAARPDTVHVFRMETSRGVLWRQPVARVGNVGTPMMVVPNVPGKLARWGTQYEADGHFLVETLAIRGDEPLFHKEIVAVIRPA